MAFDASQSVFSTDSATVEASPIQANDGFDTDGEFSWDDVETVTFEDDQWTEFFGTDTFYRIEYTVARPIEQPYAIGNDIHTFVKPRDALKKAQWSLDNRPWTLDHPPDKQVTDTSQVHGFFRDPYYIEEKDDQRIYGHLPTNDAEAKEYVRDNPGISVGYRNNFVRPDEYEGDIGGEIDMEQVDALQVDLYYDHIASGKGPRCSIEDGCGPVTDTANQMIPLTQLRGVDGISTTTQSGAGNAASDAHTLDTSTESNDGDSTIDTMTDCTCDDGSDGGGMDFSDLEQLGADTIASNNDAVAELQEQVEQHEMTIDTLESDLEEAKEQRDAAKEQVGTLNDTLSEYEAEKFDEKVGTLTDLTDHWPEDELRESFEEGELTTDTIDERIDLAREMSGDSGSEEEATDTTISNDTTDTTDITNDADTDDFDGTFIN